MRKNSWTIRRIWTALFVFLVLTTGQAATAGAAWKEITVKSSDYYLEMLKFLYLTEDYLAASTLAERTLSKNEGLKNDRRFSLLRLLSIEALKATEPKQGAPTTVSKVDHVATALGNTTQEVFVLPYLTDIAIARGDMASAGAFMEALFKSTTNSYGRELVGLIRRAYPDFEDTLLKMALWHAEKGEYHRALTFIDAGRPFLSRLGLVRAGLIRAYTLVELQRKREALESLEHTEELADSLIDTYREILSGGVKTPAWKILPQRKEVAKLERLHTTLERLASLYRASLEEAITLSTTVEERLLAREESLTQIQEAMERTDGLLQRLMRLLAVRYHASTETVQLHADTITRRWQRLLNRKLTDTEKTMVYLALLDGREALWYLDNTMYCQLLYFMTLEDERTSTEQPARIFDIILTDLESVADENNTVFSKRLKSIESLAIRATEKDNYLFSELKEVINTIKTSLRTIEKELRRIHSLSVRLSIRYAYKELERLEAMKTMTKELTDMVNKGMGAERFLETLKLLTPPPSEHFST